MIEALVGLWIGTSAVMLAAQEVNPWVPSGLALTGVMAVLALLWKIQKSYVKTQDHKIAVTSLEAREAKLGEALCEWRLNKVTEYLRVAHGIAVPDDIWSNIPGHLSTQIELLSAERKRLNA